MRGVCIERVVLVHLHLHEAGISHDRAQEVVEVVRDAAGEGTYRLHFLGLKKLRFKMLALGDIRVGADNPQGFPVLGPDKDLAPVKDPFVGAVFGPQAVLTDVDG